jgi:large subunit ribosomal protein L23
MKTSFEILLKPILTEKLTAQESLNRYGFFVDRSANKIQIKKAVEEMYGITVESVNTMRYAGKSKSRYTKAGIIAGKANAFKKAIITVKKGDKIDFYSNI